MLNILPTEINNLIWDHLSNEDVVQMGFVSKDYYLYFLDPIASKDLYYKNTSRSGLSKIKFSIKLKQIIRNTAHYEKHKYRFIREHDHDVFTTAFNHVNKLNLDKIGTILKTYSGELLETSCSILGHFVFPDLCITLKFIKSNENKEALVYTLFLGNNNTIVNLTAYSRHLMMVSDTTIYLNQDLNVIGGKIIFRTAYLKYNPCKCYNDFKYVNYVLQTAEIETISGRCRDDYIRLKSIFWYVIDTAEFHIIGISTLGQNTEIMYFDLYLINKTIFDETLADVMDIDLNSEPHYLIQIPYKSHPSYVYSNLNSDGSKLYILLTTTKEFVIIVFDIFSKSFKHEPFYSKLAYNWIGNIPFRIVNDDYLLIFAVGSHLEVYWFDIRRFALKLDTIDTYDITKIHGLCIFPDGILVKSRQGSNGFNVYNYDFY